jgi:hypothetical protein
MAKVVQLTFILIFYFHVCACIYFFEARQYQIWMPALEMGSLTTDIFIAPVDK